MSYSVHTISFPLPAAEDDCIVYKASTKGGKVTVTDFFVTNHATTSGTATFTAALHKRNSAATVTGTISTLGGTADHWTDSTPKTGTLDSSYVVLDEGECLSLSYAAVDGGSHTRGYATVHYVMGR